MNRHRAKKFHGVIEKRVTMPLSMCPPGLKPLVAESAEAYRQKMGLSDDAELIISIPEILLKRLQPLADGAPAPEIATVRQESDHSE